MARFLFTYCALTESFCSSSEMEELSLAFLLPLSSRSALSVADLLPLKGGGGRDGFKPAFQGHRGWDGEFGEGDVFGPAGEELGEEFLDLLPETVLVS